MSAEVLWARCSTDGLLHAYRDERAVPVGLCGATGLTGMHGIGPGRRCVSCELLAAVPDPQFGQGSEWPGLTRDGGGTDGRGL